jgi:hypothetical protein
VTGIVADTTTLGGRERLTCTGCGTTLVQQPWMSEVRWRSEVWEFREIHPNRCKEKDDGKLDQG